MEFVRVIIMIPNDWMRWVDMVLLHRMVTVMVEDMGWVSMEVDNRMLLSRVVDFRDI